MGLGGCLFEAGYLLTFSAFKMGANSRKVLIGGWALIQINMVGNSLEFSPFFPKIQHVLGTCYSFIRNIYTSGFIEFAIDLLLNRWKF